MNSMCGVPKARHQLDYPRSEDSSTEQTGAPGVALMSRGVLPWSGSARLKVVNRGADSRRASSPTVLRALRAEVGEGDLTSRRLRFRSPFEAEVAGNASHVRARSTRKTRMNVFTPALGRDCDLNWTGRRRASATRRVGVSGCMALLRIPDRIHWSRSIGGFPYTCISSIRTLCVIHLCPTARLEETCTPLVGRDAELREQRMIARDSWLVRRLSGTDPALMHEEGS